MILSDEAIDECYTLNVGKALEPTPDGVMSFYARNILRDGEVFDSIYLMSPTWGHDHDISEERFKAKISSDGRAILVSKPRIPVMFFGVESSEEVINLWDNPDDELEEDDEDDEPPMDQAVILSHLIMASEIHAADPARLTKTVAYKMPGTLTIKADPFNAWNEEGLIRSKVVYTTSVVETSGDGEVAFKKMAVQIPHIQWHVAIDQAARVIKKPKKTNKTGSALKRALKKHETPTKSMDVGNDDS